MDRDRLEFEANLVGKFHARHWVDHGKRFMEYRGFVFVWEPGRELWLLEEEGCE